jgi:hypothetical protein
VVEIATRFQSLVSSALLSGHSREDVFRENPALRLAPSTINRGETFAKAMATHGHAFDFHTENLTAIMIAAFKDDDSIDVRMVADPPDIAELTHKNVLVPPPSHEDIIQWIEELYRESRGFELGTFDASILSVTLKEQAAGWRDLALGYISDVIALVHGFVVDVLRRIAPTRRMSDGIKSLLLENLTEMYRRALEHTNFLLSVELDGTPATYNHYFNDNLQKRYV